MFEAKQYTEAAELYSTIQMPFERILLLYLDKVDDDVDAQYGFISRSCLLSPAAKEARVDELP